MIVACVTYEMEVKVPPLAEWLEEGAVKPESRVEVRRVPVYCITRVGHPTGQDGHETRSLHE